MMSNKPIILDDVRIPPLKVIEEAETLSSGHTADLVIEEYQTAADGRMLLVRFWRNRVGPEDGEPFAVDVEARECPDGTWTDVGKLYPRG